MRDGGAKHGAQHHNAHNKGKAYAEDAAHTLVFFRAVVVTQYGAHALHNAVCRQIQKGLQFVIRAKHKHVSLRKHGKDRVEHGDHQGGKRHVQRRRNAYGIGAAADLCKFRKIFKTDLHGKPLCKIDHKIDHQRNDLPDSRGKRRALYAHFGKDPPAEYQNGIQNDIRYAARQHGNHGNRHFADCLKGLFKTDPGGNGNAEQENNIGIADAVIQNHTVVRKHAQKHRHDKNTAGQYHAVQQVKEHACRGSSIRMLLSAGAEVERDHGVYADSITDGNGSHQILNRVNKRQRRHRVLAYLCNEITVYDIV